MEVGNKSAKHETKVQKRVISGGTIHRKSTIRGVADGKRRLERLTVERIAIKSGEKSRNTEERS